MPDKYISVEAFTASMQERYCKNCDRRKGMKNGKLKTVYSIGDAPCRPCGIDDMLDDIDAYPPADVRPVVRGVWERPDGATPKSWLFRCSNCGDIVYWPIPKNQKAVCGYPLCPFRGADMRGTT